MPKKKRENLTIILYVDWATIPVVSDCYLFGLQTLRHVMHMPCTWDSTMPIRIPKELGCQLHSVNYGRIIYFGKDVAESPSAKIEWIDLRMEQRIVRKMLVLVQLE
uniref:Uncharacterized protein LOC114914568 n=1 Tax=Elaeis guineensis var. tenera TaxID=51953 RepID=A0A8N4F1M0_ELAGV|nr:uncharacterized protein LOC114914568 [Elaeis guineensis]